MCDSCATLPAVFNEAKRRIQIRASKTRRKDPTGTVTVRNSFQREMVKRFSRLKGDVIEAIVTDDVFGLKQIKPFSISNRSPGPRAYAFATTGEKFNTFMDWFRDQSDQRLLSASGELPSDPGERWTDPWIKRGYDKGSADSFIELKKRLRPEEMNEKIYGGASMTKEEFLRSSFLNSPANAEALEMLFTRAFDDLKNISSVMSVQLGRELADGLARGDNPLTIASRITDRIDKIGITRARTLARTEIIRAHAESTLNNYERFGQEGVAVMAEWSTAGDDRVCPACAPLDGVVFTISQARGLIPLHPSCLTGDALVTPVGRITAVSKRKYDGDMIVFDTSGGHNITCTPNHPICTNKGFVPARLINEGHEIVCYSIDKWKSICIDGDDINTPSRIEDIAESFLNNVEVSSSPVPLTSKDFHGDSTNGNVAIIGTYRSLLLNSGHSTIFEHLNEINLILRNIAGFILVCICSLALLMPRMLTPLRCLMSLFNLSISLLFGHLGPLDQLRFALIPNVNRRRFKPYSYCFTANSKKLGYSVFRHPALIKICDLISRQIDFVLHSRILSSKEFSRTNITKKTIVQYSGYVYNLETTASYYISDGIASHNCRCAHVPALEDVRFKDQKYGKAAQEAISRSNATGLTSSVADRNPTAAKE